MPTPLMAIGGLPFIFSSSGISPPSPNRDCSVTAAVRTAATPASTALPPVVSSRYPASTSKLFAAPTISRVPRTGQIIVGCARQMEANRNRKSRTIGGILSHRGTVGNDVAVPFNKATAKPLCEAAPPCSTNS